MRMGMMVGEGSGTAPDLKSLVNLGKLIESAGFDSAWIANIALDAMTASAVLGGATNRVEIGTAVVPVYNRHPTAMLNQASSTQQACDGRFTLGLGLGHKFLVEDMWGLSYAKPARYMRDYLEAVVAGVSGDAVKVNNDHFNLNLRAGPSSRGVNELLIAALGPAMLRVAGEMTGGTITWATGVKTIAEHIAPKLNEAAASAGRPVPRVVAGYPVLLTNNVEAARTLAASLFAVYAQIPSYRAMLDREGAGGVEDIAIIGNEKEIRNRLSQLSSAGVTDLCVFPFETEAGEIERTVKFLADEKRG